MTRQEPADILVADHRMPKVPDLLCGNNLMSNTTLIYAGDHGDWFGFKD